MIAILMCNVVKAGDVKIEIPSVGVGQSLDHLSFHLVGKRTMHSEAHRPLVPEFAWALHESALKPVFERRETHSPLIKLKTYVTILMRKGVEKQWQTERIKHFRSEER